MLVRFTGFKQAPIRDHIIVLVNGRHQMVGLGETVDIGEEDAYRLRSTGEFEIVEEKKSVIEKPPAASNRAILNGKAE